MNSFIRSNHHKHLQKCLYRLSFNKKTINIYGIERRQASVYSWGKSNKCTIPLSSASDGKKHIFDIPQKIIKEMDGVKKFVCGHNSSSILFENGKCLTFGENDSGQLGQGNKKDVLVPTPLPDCDLSHVGVSNIVLGKNFSAAIDNEGDLYTFGFGGSTLSGLGCLGHGDGESYLLPKRVESLVEDGCLVNDVQVGETHMTVLTTEGEVLTTGAGSYGRLGNLESSDQLYLEPVEMLASEKVAQIAGGPSFTLALTEEGVIYGWGRNDKGQLGVGGGLMIDMYAMENLPRPIEGQLEGRKIVKIAAGYSHSACISDAGEFYLWGMRNFLEPQPYSSMLHTKCIDVACGNDYTMILTEKNLIHGFGKNKTGVLGQANTKSLNYPELVESIANKKAYNMSAGASHFACVVEEKQDEEVK